jgi:hypothetical protein
MQICPVKRKHLIVTLVELLTAVGPTDSGPVSRTEIFYAHAWKCELWRSRIELSRPVETPKKVI